MITAPSEIGLLPQLLQATELRHRVISQNIANVNTPGYRARVVKFEAELASRLESGASATALDVAPQVEPESGLALRPDGNNVDIDRESGRLHQNALLYQTYSQVLASYYDSLRRSMTSA